MAIPKMLIFLLLTGVFAWLSVTYLGASWFSGIVMGLGLVALVSMFGFPLVPAPLNTRLMLILLVVAGVGAAWLYSSVPSFLKMGEITENPTTSTTIVNSADCAASVPAESRGLASTADVNAYDMESATPYSSAVDNNPSYLFLDGAYQTALTDTSASTINTAIGKVLTVYPGGINYYGDKFEACVLDARPAVEIATHAVAAESSMAITGYDSDATTALTTGTTNEEDYAIAMGANENAVFYLKLKNNQANKQFNLGAICTRQNGDVDKCQLAESGFTKEVPADFVATTRIEYNDTTHANLTGGYDACWVPNSPVVMHQWDEVKYKFEISSSSSGTDSDDSPATTSSDLCIVNFLDAQWSRGSDGKMYHDYWDHSVNGANVGMAENSTVSPYGKQLGVIIEGT